MAMLLQLSLCVLTVIQLTSSQSTYDVIQHENDVNSCGGNDAVLSQLMTAMSQIQSAVSQLQTDVASNQDKIQQLTCLSGARDCSEVFNCGQHSDGVYTVYLGTAGRPPVEVYCDMTTEGGVWTVRLQYFSDSTATMDNWDYLPATTVVTARRYASTVFQRRQYGSEDFYRYWADYRTGFGNLTGEFWLGNDNLHLLTSGTRQRLRIDLADFEGNTSYAEYDNFRVDSAAEKYRLVSLGTYNGTAGDSLTTHRGRKFSTRDQDNDEAPGSCAAAHKGAWWYSYCHASNLNGRYLIGRHTSYADGVSWEHWTGHHYSLRFTEMKIRPFND